MISPSWPPLDAKTPCTRPDVSAEWFFPLPSESAEPARRLCNACDLRADCLTWALTQGETLEGIWGATTQPERKRLLRRHKRQCPDCGTALVPRRHYCDPCRDLRRARIKTRNAERRRAA